MLGPKIIPPGSTSNREVPAPYELLASEALVLFGLLLSALTWRIAVRELDSSVHVAAASKIYLLGQLGKYLPGSLWAVAAQTALAKRSGVPPSRGAAPRPR